MYTRIIIEKESRAREAGILNTRLYKHNEIHLPQRNHNFVNQPRINNLRKMNACEVQPANHIFDPTNISVSPPNDFMNNLQKRINLYM